MALEFGLIILDLDNLKEINDLMGHSQGDRVLMDLANLATHAVRSSDRVFRYGGDEFVILVANVTPSGLEEVCKNLLRKVNESMRCNDMPVTVSIGAALLGAEDGATQWFRKADSCLYQAKNDGRNRYSVHC